MFYVIIVIIIVIIIFIIKIIIYIYMIYNVFIFSARNDCSAVRPVSKTGRKGSASTVNGSHRDHQQGGASKCRFQYNLFQPHPACAVLHRTQGVWPLTFLFQYITSKQTLRLIWVSVHLDLGPKEGFHVTELIQRVESSYKYTYTYIWYIYIYIS